MPILIKKLKRIFAVCLIVSFFGCADGLGSSTPGANSGGTSLTSITLTWNPVTTKMDGTPLTDLAGYKVYSGTGPGNLTLLSDVGNTTSYTANGVQSGKTTYFSVTTYDSNGVESYPSNLISS
ncbi:MAG: hypothetical protein ACYDBV_00200 [Nitrospiria bacterium]